MRVLVTGGAGFIGSHIVDRLADDGHEVDVIDDVSSGSTANLRAGVALHEVDLADTAVVDLIGTMVPDCIVHCAAQVSVSASVADPTEDARRNVLGGINAMRGAAAAGSRSFVYLTTGGALYGEPRYLPCDEDHPIAPISPYGLSKATVERYLELLLPAARRVVLRLANVYGPRQPMAGESGVVGIFADRMRRGLPVEIHGDGEQTRDFVFVQDTVDATVASLGSGASAVVNIGTGIGTTINALFRTMAEIAGYRDAPSYVAARVGDVRHSVLAIDRARQVLGWRPRTSLPDGLRETYRATR